MTPKFCSQCGHPAGSNANFCENCGATMGASPPPSSSSRPSSLPESPKVTPPPPPKAPSSTPADDPLARPSSLPETEGSSSAPVGVGWRPAGGRVVSPKPPSEAVSSKPPIVDVLFSKTIIVGYVRGLTQRFAAQNLQVISFRVETFDAQGNRQAPVTVEMKGIGFEGSLNEGDQVEINQKPRPGKTIKVAKVRNITAGSTFKAQEYPFLIRILGFPVTLIGWIITVAFVIGFFAILWTIISDML